jgi:serine/threonine protein kinase/beta-lactam-binding protein with PASTA domain
VARVGDEALVGRILDGRYLIGERIARGGMASVYMANDRRLDRTVAVKVMHQDLGDETQFLERFNREAKAAAKLNHRGVVAVFDQGQDRDVTYLVMEYVPGHTLRDVMRNEAPMTPERSLGILADVLVALSAAHAAGIVHRDVKPENVLITPDGEIKVADFGLARAVSNATTAPGGPLIGTVSYIAPEIVTGEGSDARSDVYACGAMLYEMLTGSKPHGGDSPIQIAYKHVHEDVAAPSAAQSGIPPYIDALVARATTRDRNERPADARALLRMVRRVQRALDQGLTDDPKLTEELTPPPVVDRDDLPDEATIAVSVPTAPVTLEKSEPAGDGDDLSPMFPTTLPAPGEPTVAWTTGAPPQRGVVPAISTEQYQDDREGHDDDPRGRYLLIAAVAAAALVGLIGWYLGFGRYDDAPLLVGMSETEAVDAAQADGFVLKITEHTFSETAARGTILSTDPEAGANILPGATIEGVLSKGKERYAVPDLSGLKASQAVSSLRAKHLQIGDVSEEYSDDVAKGRIKELSGVDAGQLVKRDTKVNIVVSKGPEPVAVPNFTGQSSGSASSGLRGRGFLVRIVYAYSDDVDKGRVISQSPSGGTRFRGDTITINVSNGPEEIDVPDVTGDQCDDAKDELKSAGFKVSASGSGNVTNQSPSDTAKVGSTIDISCTEEP